MNQKVGISLSLRSRPFDFYVAFLVFFIGIYGIFDPTWPERFDGPTYWIVVVEDIYLICASLTIMISFMIRQGKGCQIKTLIPSIVAEAFGWLFISASASVIALTSWVIPPSALISDDIQIKLIWFGLWAGLAVSSLLRSLDLKRHYKIRSISR